MASGGGRHGFDWLMGQWAVRNRRLVARGDPSGTAWEEFGAHAVVTQALAGPRPARGKVTLT